MEAELTSIKIMDYKTIIISVSDGKHLKCYTISKKDYNQDTVNGYIERFKKEIKYGF